MTQQTNEATQSDRELITRLLRGDGGGWREFQARFDRLVRRRYVRRTTADRYERQLLLDGRIDCRCLDPDVARVRRGPPGAAAGGEGKDDELYRDPTYQGAAVFPR